MAMGLCGWEVTYNTSEQSTTDGDWLRFCFHRPRSKVPLAIFHLSGEFDLPAGGGHGKVGLGYVSTGFGLCGVNAIVLRVSRLQATGT